jgi:hypothetical protein
MHLVEHASLIDRNLHSTLILLVAPDPLFQTLWQNFRSVYRPRRPLVMTEDPVEWATQLHRAMTEVTQHPSTAE